MSYANDDIYGVRLYGNPNAEAATLTIASGNLQVDGKVRVGGDAVVINNNGNINSTGLTVSNFENIKSGNTTLSQYIQEKSPDLTPYSKSNQDVTFKKYNRERRYKLSC